MSQTKKEIKIGDEVYIKARISRSENRSFGVTIDNGFGNYNMIYIEKSVVIPIENDRKELSERIICESKNDINKNLERFSLIEFE